MLHIAIATGLILGILVGLAASATGNEVLLAIANGSAPFGTIFINAIRMVVLPLIITVIFSSIAKLGDPRKLGRIGGMTLAFYWATLIPAIMIGMGVMKLGLQFSPMIEMPSANAADMPPLPGIIDFLVSLVPANPFAAASSGAILPVIVFTALVAAATGTLELNRRERLITLSEDASLALMKLVWWILYIAPIGVFGLAAPVIAKLGWDLVLSLGVFIISVFVGLSVLMIVLFVPLLYFVGKIGPARFFSSTFGAASIAFSTTSTAAAIPISLEETTKNLKVPESIADLLIPLGASMYRPGSALFQGAAIVFLAHLYAVPIPAAAIGAAILATFLVSLTVAPVPSSGVVTMMPALETVGVPIAGLSFLLGIDRIPDMMRSAVNVMSQITTAVLVGRWTADKQDQPDCDQGDVDTI